MLKKHNKFYRKFGGGGFLYDNQHFKFQFVHCFRQNRCVQTITFFLRPAMAQREFQNVEKTITTS